MATAKKLPSGNYRVRVYDNKTGTTRSFTASTKKEAEYLANEWLTGRAKDPVAITLNDAIDLYIESKNNVLSPSTIRGYRTAQRNAYKAIKDLRLDEINELILQKWVNGNAAEYGSKSIHNQYGLLTAVLGQNHIKLDFDSVLLPQKEKPDYEIPTPETMGNIMAALSGHPAEIPILIALMCGLRQSEIAALRWEDYDGSRLRIHAAVVPDENNKLVRKEHAKSYAGNRYIDVPAHLKTVLDASPRSGDNISPYKTPSGVLKALQNLCERIGLPKYKMHALRHAYASLMLKEGVADKYAMERLGQSTPHMIKNVYQHTFKSEQDAISAKLNEAFEKLAGVS